MCARYICIAWMCVRVEDQGPNDGRQTHTGAARPGTRQTQRGEGRPIVNRRRPAGGVAHPQL